LTYLPSVNQGRSQMMYTLITFLLLVVVTEAQLPSRQAQHHDALTGRVQRIPDLFVKGHVRDNFLIRNPIQHHDALTGSVQHISDLFVKGHVRDNFVLKPQPQHHDALTGSAPRISDLFIKGHVSDPPQAFEDYSLQNSIVADIALPSRVQEFTFCKVSGNECSQYTLKRQWMVLATTFGAFQMGTCWEHGYNVNAGSKEISMPFIGKTQMRFFTSSNTEVPLTEVFTQTSPDVIGAMVVALISLVGISGGIFAMLRARRGIFMADKESLLASSQA
jgi:hypothetical protein